DMWHAWRWHCVREECAAGDICPRAAGLDRDAARSAPPMRLCRLRRCGAVLLVPQRRGHEDDPDDDRGVGDVEGPEADVTDPDVDEIDDVSLGDAVEKISERATKLHPEGRRHEGR